MKTITLNKHPNGNDFIADVSPMLNSRIKKIQSFDVFDKAKIYMHYYITQLGLKHNFEVVDTAKENWQNGRSKRNHYVNQIFMVTCRLVGGLANQMFTIAATIGYAEKHKMPFHIPAESSHPDHWKTHFHNIAGSVVPDPMAPWQPFIYYDQRFSYSEIPYYPDITLVPSDITTGYFQSEMYFAHCRQQVRAAFNFPYLKKEGWVSVHIRRGDYLHENNKDFYRTPTTEYLEQSIRFFYEKGYRNFLIVTDDPAWRHDFIRQLKLSSVVTFNFPECDPINDMQAASCCEHNIGSASSFSWWIAWLNQNPEKICIFPQPWFGPGGPKDTQDLLPSEWISVA